MLIPSPEWKGDMPQAPRLAEDGLLQRESWRTYTMVDHTLRGALLAHHESRILRPLIDGNNCWVDHFPYLG